MNSFQSPKADVFGGAVALYFALGAKMPFQGVDLMTTLKINARAMVRLNGAPFEDVSRGTKNTLKALLHRSPHVRPNATRATALLTELIDELESNSGSLSIFTATAPYRQLDSFRTATVPHHQLDSFCTATVPHR